MKDFFKYVNKERRGVRYLSAKKKKIILKDTNIFTKKIQFPGILIADS
jgi:hypothetical protein